MYSISVRFNEIFFFGFYTLVFLCFANYLSGLYQTRNKNVTVDFKMKRTKSYVSALSSKNKVDFDSFIGEFDLKISKIKDIDNWNVKQFYMYLEAVWEVDKKVLAYKEQRHFLGQNSAQGQNPGYWIA